MAGKLTRPVSEDDHQYQREQHCRISHESANRRNRGDTQHEAQARVPTRAEYLNGEDVLTAFDKLYDRMTSSRMGRYSAGRDSRASSSSPVKPSTSLPKTRATPRARGPVAGGNVISAIGIDPSLRRLDIK